MDRVKEFWAFTVGVILTVFVPLSNALWVIGAMAMFDWIAGSRASMRVDGEEFSIRKFFTGITLFTVFMMAVFMIYNGAMSFHDQPLADLGTKWFCVIVAYSYALNIFKNLQKLFPNIKAISFIYDLLSLDALQLIMAKFGLTNLKSIEKYERDKEDKGN